MPFSVRHTRSGIAWGILYAVLVLAPVGVLASGLGGAGGTGRWFDFSMALGFGALGLFAGQFVLTARFRRATAPFGIDVIYVFHRWLAGVALALIVGHWVILRAEYPHMLGPATPLEAPFYMTAGRLALLTFAILVASSVWRKRLGIEYDRWRIAHAGLAVVGVTGALLHVRGVGYYSDIFWNRTVLDILLGSLVALVVMVRVVKPILAYGRPYRVTEVRPEAGSTWIISVAPDGHDGIHFQPGQFGWLSLGVPPWQAKEHPFSFSGSAETEGILEFTVKELGDFTRRVGQTEVGTRAYVDGPHGSFSVDRYPSAPAFVFIAGGVGIAPIVSMLRTLADRGDQRPLRVLHGSSSIDRVVHKETLARLEDRLKLQVTHVLEDPPAGWGGAAGLPRYELVEEVMKGLPADTHVFLCGPEPMSEMAQRSLRRLGIPIWKVHHELFDMA